MKNINSICIVCLTLLISFSAPTSAASPCKGETEKACTNKDSCSWIKAHKRKDGAKVKAYCRTKAGKKAKSMAAATPIEKTTPSKKDKTQKVNTTTTKK